MKAIGTRNGKIYVYHALRFLFAGIIAVFIGEMFAMPLTHLCVDPIFKMMGMELAVDYVINPVEVLYFSLSKSSFNPSSSLSVISCTFCFSVLSSAIINLHIFIFCTTKGSPLWTAFCIIYAIYFLLQNYYLIRFYLLQFTPVSFLLLIIIMNISVFDSI